MAHEVEAVTCQRCDGLGFLQVGEGYVDIVCPVTPPPVENPQSFGEIALNENVSAWNEMQRRSHAHSWFPCPTCQPEAYDRWLAGDWPNPRPKSKAGGDLREAMVAERRTVPEGRRRRDLDDPEFGDM